MELEKWVAHQEEYTFLIQEEGVNIGCYLFVWRGNECIKDYLQGEKEVCLNQVLEEYKVPLEDWKQIPSDTNVNFSHPKKLRDIASVS